jgi:uncharacterized circularly permuted ATP-grasp superfamily protein
VSDTAPRETPLYMPDLGLFDEAVAADGSPRPHYAALLAALGEADLEELSAAVANEVRRHGVSFRADGRTESFHLDPVPRLLVAAEWAELERGLRERVRALDQFVADVYGERRIVADGVLPEGTLEGCDHLEPRLAELPPQALHIGVAGLDVVRGADGFLRVLEDNVRTPSGLAYSLTARAVLEASLPHRAAEGPRGLGDIAGALMRTLRAAAPAPTPDADPTVVLLSDGRENSAWYEHERLAALLDVPIVTLADLSVRAGRLVARVDGRRSAVDVVYRRTDEDRLTDERGELTPVGAALFEPLRAGRLACVNAFGTGVADDKLITAYVEDMVRFYLGVEPSLRSVRTYDPQVPEQRATVLDRIGELVIKPRSGFGGHGVVVAPHARPEDVRAAGDALAADPAGFVAQEAVALSTHPTVVGPRLEPRHVDLRPFVLLAGDDEGEVIQGGLTRVALEPGALVVNSSQRGGCKDTWVVA